MSARNPERAAQILAAAQEHGVTVAAEKLGLTWQAVYASLKKWYPHAYYAKQKGVNGTPLEVKGRINRRRYKRLVESNICGRCFKVPATKGHKTCEPCRDKMKAAYHARKKSKKA
jgi:hypothetical protein